MSNYYRDEVNHDANENNAANNRINSNKPRASTPLEYKTKFIGNTPNNNNILDVKVVANFWRYLDLSLINCEIKTDLP